MTTKLPFIPLHQLLTQRTMDEWDSIWQETSVDFQAMAFALANILNQDHGNRIILLAHDRLRFLSGLLAGLYSGKEVVIPHASTPGVIEELTQPDDFILDDDQLLFKERSRSLDTVCSSSGWINLYTSGSTGTGKKIRKDITQLESEIQTLETLWGSSKGQSVFLSTVPHHHIYGLLFSLLWPVCAGYRIAHKTYPFWEDLVGQYGPVDYLISSPAHLNRLPDNQDLYAPFARIFSSGAPLSFDHATQTFHHFGVLPTEVFGSTETGGIAQRQQHQEQEPWTPFPDIKIRTDDQHHLHINSPYLSGDDYYVTEDQISMVDHHRFHLIGRADRIVKVEGKRVSLTEIERRLNELPDIKENIALPMEATQRHEIGVVAVLTPAGQKRLTQEGKSQFSRSLRQYLKPYFDQVVLPRRWRFVEEIPVDNRGKRPQNLLKELFVIPENTVKENICLPEIRTQTIAENSVALTLYIPESLIYCQGHFPDFPLVPGVVQLHWAVHFAKELFGVSGLVTGAQQIKFSQFMRPKDELQLIIDHAPEQKFISYRFVGENTTYSSGRFTYEL